MYCSAENEQFKNHAKKKPACNIKSPFLVSHFDKTQHHITSLPVPCIYGKLFEELLVSHITNSFLLNCGSNETATRNFVAQQCAQNHTSASLYKQRTLH